MQMQPKLILTDKDYERISSLLIQKDSEEVDRLWEELSRAQIISQNEIPKDVVTMNSMVRIRDVPTGEEKEIILVYPNQADINLGKISILAPIGMALIGLRAGQSITWVVPNGSTRQVEVVEVAYQPEAHGVFEL